MACNRDMDWSPWEVLSLAFLQAAGIHSCDKYLYQNRLQGLTNDKRAHIQCGHTLSELVNSVFPTSSNTNQAVQPQKTVRGLKFRV